MPFRDANIYGQYKQVVVENLKEATDRISILTHRLTGKSEAAPEGDRSVWWYDDTIDEWRLATTFGEWCLLGDWESGVNWDRWDLTTGKERWFNVNTKEDRIELPFEADEYKEAVFMFSRRVDLDSQALIETNLGYGGQPTNDGTYDTHLLIGDLDNGGSGPRSDRLDFFAAKFSSGQNVYRAELGENHEDSGGTGFNFNDAGDLSVGQTYYGTLSVGKPTNRDKTWGDIDISGVVADNLSIGENYRTGRPGFWLRTQEPDVDSVPWVGNVWIRR